MKSLFYRCFLIIVLLSNLFFLNAQVGNVFIKNGKNGIKMQVNGKDFFINGMNWDYFPIGTNYSFKLWNQSDDFIKVALDSEMTLLRDMGVNVIRVYTGIPAKWISYIHKNFGIYTMLNHSFGRYGLTLNGQWVATTNYSDKKVEELLLKEMLLLAKEYRNTPGLLFYLLGNENNYGLFWEGAETENLPKGNNKSEESARHMYKLFNKAAKRIKSIDKYHPVAICNGDLQFLNIIAKECKNFDIFGSNIYRGFSFGDAFERVKKEYGKPIVFTEFGADAFNMKTKEEDQTSQAAFLKKNWKEIYENTAGMGKAENCLGGFTFQFSDGWWKYNQSLNLSIQDTIASWSNGGYINDFSAKENNMNEEWFGICAKGPTDESGHYSLYPRKAYFMLKNIHNLNPYSKSTTLKSINQHFDNN